MEITFAHAVGILAFLVIVLVSFNSKPEGKQTSDLARDIRSIDQQARREIDEASDDYLRKLGDYTGRKL